MSYDPRLAARPYGAPGEDEDDTDTRKGSVRAARERLQAAQMQGQLPDRSRIVGLPQRPNQLVSQYSVQNRPRQPQDLTPPDSRGNAAALSPTPQWPLPNDLDDVLDSRPGQYLRPPQPRGPPPQRPPRPTSDELPIQQPTSPSYRESYQSDDMFSPTSAQSSSRPLTTSSAASEASSLGSIPDFPVPQPPMPTIQPLPRRNPSLGPPPSSRRGPSSYYTQMSYVSPIAEESDTRSDTIRSHHGSFASSNVIPMNAEDFYDERVLSEDEETITSDYGRDSRASDHDDRSGLVQPALVRQASLGRRTKPSLMTIKSVDSFGEKKGGPANKKSSSDGVRAAAGAAGIGSAMLAAREGTAARVSPGPPSGSLSSGTGFIDASSSSESLNSLKNIKSNPDSQRALALDMEKDLESPVHPLQQGTRQTLAERVGKRRPPRIDVDAVRDAEARGSLTSLPELIRRATRLAANLDRGKTASRLGLDFWEAGAPDRKDSRRSGSLSDMLAAFPPPGEATPTGGNTPNPRRMSKWPSGGVRGPGTDSAMSDPKTKRRRRCCGMPMWTFVTLLIVLLFLIAAAVVIPVVLIVLPKMKDNQNNAAQDTNGTGTGNNNSNTPPAPAPTVGGQDGQCNGVITCQNGGVAIRNADQSCNCVCINGFTGKTCATEGDAGCTTTSVPGTADNATVGAGIPRLIEDASQTFNVPLNPSRLLSLFSSLSLSCTAENALITFNGLASRSIPRNYIPIIVETTVKPSRSIPVLDNPHAAEAPRHVVERQAIGAPGVANKDTDATPTSAGQASATPTQPVSSDANAVDFARIGVLLALQVSGQLDTAANAQEKIQSFLTDNRQGESNGNTVNVGPFTMDLVNFSIKFQNGTTIQSS